MNVCIGLIGMSLGLLALCFFIVGVYKIQVRAKQLYPDYKLEDEIYREIT